MTDISKLTGALKLLNSKRGYKSSITTLLNKLSTNGPPISNKYFKYQENSKNQWLLNFDKINTLKLEWPICPLKKCVVVGLVTYDSELKFTCSWSGHMRPITI